MAYKTTFKKHRENSSNFEEKCKKREQQRDLFHEIADRNNLVGTDLFEEFMLERFPDEKNVGYIREWVERFKTGDPTAYMDSQSLKAYQKSIDKLRK